MLLFLAIVLGHPVFDEHFVFSAVLVIAVAAFASSAVLFLARNGWRVPIIRVTITR
jgi:hypothetical protein